MDPYRKSRRRRRRLTSPLTQESADVVGFRVETFESAEAFLTSADRDSIGCLVLDVRMPGMTGVDLLRHLAATGSRIPVIMLTAHGDDETRWRCLEAGATAFLEEPVRTPALLDAVRRALAST